MRRALIPLLILLAAFAVLGSDGYSPEPAQAAIPSSSCQGSGACANRDANVVIGANSCNGENACQYAKGTIGAGSCLGPSACRRTNNAAAAVTIGNGSCIGDYGACEAVGANGGSAVIGNGSCMGRQGCQYFGEEGDAVVGDGSCVGPDGNTTAACTGAGAWDGFARIGNGSCNPGCYYGGSTGYLTVGDDSCLDGQSCRWSGAWGGSSVIGSHSCQAGEESSVCGYTGVGRDNGTTGTASSVIGDKSCNGTDRACQDAGNGGNSSTGNSTIGKGSCNGANACFRAGALGTVSSIGNFSCNGDYYCTISDYPALGKANDVGDCEENASEPPACSGPVTVTATSLTVTYGDKAPAFTFSAAGEEGAFSDWVTPPTCTSTYTVTTAVSSSPVRIKCGGGDADGRELVYVSGYITIQRSVLTVTPDAKSWTLGTAQPAYTFAVSGFRNGDTAATAAGYVAPVCAPPKTPSLAGTYTITCTGGSAANYWFTSEGALLTVTGSLPATPTATPTATATPKPTYVQSMLTSVSKQSGYTYSGDCSTATTAGTTCSTTTTKDAQQSGTGGGTKTIVRLYIVLGGGKLSEDFMAFEFQGTGEQAVLVSQAGSLPPAGTTPTEVVRPAPAPPNTGTGTGSSQVALLLLGALAMAAGGAVVWGRSRR